MSTTGLHFRTELRKVSTMSNNTNIIHQMWQKSYKAVDDRVSRLSSELCTVQVLSGLGNMPALRNAGDSAFQGF